MIYLTLPDLSKRLGRPAFAAIEPYFGLARDEAHVPEDAYVITTRVPTARVMVHIPNRLPGATCFDDAATAEQRSALVAWERWVDLLLCAVIEQPAMEEADVQALGPDRNVIALGILKVWGWIVEEDGSSPYLPGLPMQDALRMLTHKVRAIPPSRWLDMPFPEFVLNWRVLQDRGKTPNPDLDERSVLTEDQIER